MMNEVRMINDELFTFGPVFFNVRIRVYFFEFFVNILKKHKVGELLLILPFFDPHFFYNVLCPYYYLSHKMTLRDAWQGPISIIYLIVDRMGGAAR